MQRTLEVDVDQSTWPTSSTGVPALPAFPASFAAGTSWQVDLLCFFLAIGVITTPPRTTGVSLSEYWAWVRYLNAIAADADLRLTPAFADLDAHQKTILSDDFGMGAPVLWMLDKLEISGVVDGRYFIDRIAASVGASGAPPARRGPSKSPDFVARDIHGGWHVLECKGTQGDTSKRAKQLGDAISQKRTVTFPPGHTGQRLASGLLIGVSGSAQRSSLRIIDPPADKAFLVSDGQMEFANDAIERASLARSLRLAGFGESAAVVAAPWGRSPKDRPTTGAAERRRQEDLGLSQQRARAELAGRVQRAAFDREKAGFRGREITFELAYPVFVETKAYRRAHARYGVTEEVLELLSENLLINQMLGVTKSAMTSAETPMTATSEGPNAQLTIGSSFVAELNLLA